MTQTGADPQRGLWIGYALAATGAVLFSSKGIIIKLAYAEGVDAETLLALRMALALPIYLAIGAWSLAARERHADSRPRRTAFGTAALVGILGYWFSSYADFKGLEHIAAQFERLILFTYPVFVVIFGALLFRQPVRAKALIAFAVSYVGLALIFVRDFSLGGHEILVGSIWVLCAAVTFALYQLLARQIIPELGSLLFTCIAMGAAAAVAIGQYLLLHPIEPLPARILWLGVVLAIGATVLPSFIMNAALSRISAQANSSIGMISPVATMVLAVIILGETVELIDIVGSALVLAGIGFFTLASRPREVTAD